jgi:hypothetical protein
MIYNLQTLKGHLKGDGGLKPKNYKSTIYNSSPAPKKIQ